MNPNFVAPTQTIENEIVNFCLNTLNLPFGDFWYEWFKSNNEENHSIHIQTLQQIDNIWSKITELSFIGKIFKKTEISEDILKRHDHDFNHIYIIRFKMKK